MPIVTVDWWEGRTPEQKRAVAERITDALVEEGKALQSDVIIRFWDSPRSQWARDREVFEDVPDHAWT